jgi:hypothetical protein
VSVSIGWVRRLGTSRLACTNLTISFKDGGRWEFEVSPLVRSKVARVVRGLGF